MEAERRISHPEDYATRVKHALLEPTVDTLKLVYKPFYSFEVSLRKERLGKETDIKRGAIFVDAVTGIARARPVGYADIQVASVSPSDIIPSDINEGEALESARRFSVQLERREKREVEIDDTADLVYKPVWISRLIEDNVCVVDAANGEVFTDVSFRRLIAQRVRSLFATRTVAV